MNKANKEEAEKYKGLFDQVVIADVANIDVDMEEITIDESKIKENNEFKEDISKDVYIAEALNILADLRDLE